MQIRLITLSSWHNIDEILLDHYPFVIGRHRKNDCCLPVAFVSRQHCQFLRQDDQVIIQDLESYNGTYLNGRRLRQPSPLRHGDELSLGPICFRVAFLARGPETAAECPKVTTAEIPAAVASDDTRVPVAGTDSVVGNTAAGGLAAP
jgi:predicted component of type VI protein secretion system